MASGHVNRIYRPNTWLHRPSLRREDFSCQPGAVHTWHETDMPTVLRDVRSRGQSGKHVLALSFSGFDPLRTLAFARTARHAVKGRAEATRFKGRFSELIVA